MSNTVLFHHIPKTAGTTIYSILESKYHPDARFRINGMSPGESIREFEKMDQARVEKFKLIYGHLADHLLPYTKNDITYVTFLREPIDHFLSIFYYIKRASHNRHHEVVKNIKDIEAFIELRSSQNLDNLQTRHLSGETHFLLEPGQTPGEALANSPQILQKAINRVKENRLVLLTEYFDESMLILKEELQWKTLPFYKVKNRTQSRPLAESFPNNILDEIHRLCKTDIALYSCAQDQFKKNFDLEAKDFQRRLKRFQRLNRVAGLLA